VIFEATSDDDFTDPKVWARVNPGHGITVQHDGIAQECQEAIAEPRKRNDFLMFHLNRWVNQATAWIPVEWWDACSCPLASDDEFAVLPCAGGLDLAQKIDLACFSLVFRHRLDPPLAVEVVAEEGDRAVTQHAQLNYRVSVLPFFWIPEDTMRQREHEDGVPYSDWVHRGLVTATEGTTIDYDRIIADITTRIVPRFPRLRSSTIGYDPAFASDLATALNKFAGRTDWCQEVLQNYKYMSEVCFMFEALVKAGRVSHGGNRILRNHVEAVAIKRDDAGRIRPTKPRNSKKHIDGVVATLMGIRSLAAIPDRAVMPQLFFVGRRR
jgi:phage terminase large subunit-like protein